MGNKQRVFGKKKHKNCIRAVQRRTRQHDCASEPNIVIENPTSSAIQIVADPVVGDIIQLEDVGVVKSCNGEVVSNVELADADDAENFILDLVDFLSNNDEDIGDDIEVHQGEDTFLNDEEHETELSEATDTKDIPLIGRRIVEINSFFEGINKLNSHNSTNNCNFSNMRCVKEFKQGLNSIFTFKCDVCQHSGVIKTNPATNKQLEVNYASVLGSYATGIGFYQSEEFFGTLEVPFMSSGTYDNRQKKLQRDLKEHAEKLKKEAVEEEKQKAIENNEVETNGIPLIDVYADTSWAKRSYRTHYNSLSGTACLIGFHTKKIIWHGVKNKYCRTCAVTPEEQTPKEHICNRNYIGPSTGMEAALILEAFRNSEKDYGVRYRRLIADGDSKAYKTIEEAKVYRNPTRRVEKIECCLHMYRNAEGHLMKIKTLSDTLSERLLTGIKTSRKHWAESDLSEAEKIENIRKDVLNAQHHIFGDHSKCHKYFCDENKHKNDINCIPKMKRNGTYNSIMKALARLLENPKSLLLNLNTNLPEQFNSVIAKHIGGKRVNFCTGGSYEGRSNASVISFNTGRLVSEMRKSVLGESESDIMNTVIYKIESNRLKRRKTIAKPSYLRKICLPDEHYGTDTCQRPDIDSELFEIKKALHLNHLKEQQNERTKIQKDTCGPTAKNYKEQIEEDILTAPNFGKICRVTDKISYPPLVFKIRYLPSKLVNAREIKQEQLFESNAIENLKELLNITIENCGVFIDEHFEFLGATPTGLTDNNGIVQIKFPPPAFKMDINEAIVQRKITFWSMSRKQKNADDVQHITGINLKHDWYYEVQGLLHITKRDFCVLAVWSGHEENSKCFKYEYIYPCNLFWKNQMEEKLQRFYYDEVLPEIIDSRKDRNMPIRGIEEISFNGITNNYANDDEVTEVE